MESADICTGSIDACASHIRSPSDISVQAHRQEMKWGVFFVKKSGPFLNAGCIMCSISIFYFTFYFIGGAYTPNAPPAYGPALLVKTTDDKRKCRKKRKKKHKSYTEVNNNYKK